MRAGARFSCKARVQGAFEEIEHLPGARAASFRNGAAQLVRLLGEVGAFVSLHKWDAAQWLEGDLHAEIGAHKFEGGVSVKLCSNMGYGLCDPVFPPLAYLGISFDQVRWILVTVPELATPLVWWFDGDHVVFRLPEYAQPVAPPPISDSASA